MLLGNFFNINDRTITDNNFKATLEINAMHPIFEGHFPGQPVVPGVCMMQMFKELLETVVEKKTMMRKADFLKFLAVINPLEHPVINVEFSYDTNDKDIISVNGRLYYDAVTFLKFRGEFREAV
jgi:3-hydroxyacyl-[acyl-carrier-protein] dehydratase